MTNARHRIDTHHHIIPPRYLEAERDRVVGAAPQRAKDIIEWSIQQTLEVMDESGTATAITSISAPGVWFGNIATTRRLARECNEFAAQIVRDHPGRFGVFAALPLPDVDGSLQEIEYALDTLKAEGIGLVTSYGDRWPGDPAFAPVFAELNRRHAVVYFHPLAPDCCSNLIPNVPASALEFPFDTTRAIVSLLYSGTFSRCPDIKWIFSHGGGALPMLAHRIESQLKARPALSSLMPHGAIHEFGKLYYDVVNATGEISFAAVRKLAGISHLLFGSDYPFMHPNSSVQGLAALGLSPEELFAIERGNALGLLPNLRR